MTTKELREKKQRAKGDSGAVKRKKRPRTDERYRESTATEKKKRKNAQSPKNPQGNRTGKKKPKANSNNSNKRKRNKNKRSNKIITWLFDILFIVFIILMLGGAALFRISDEADKSFFGYRFYEVLTNSMRKTKDGQTGNFIAGDMVIVKIEDSNNIEVGDIITFVPNRKSLDTYLTHRVIEKEPAKEEVTTDDSGSLQVEENYPTFVTQGDANNAADPPVSGDMVIGVVKVAIPKAGTIIRFVRGNLVAVLVFVVCLFLLIITIRQYFAPNEAELPAKGSKGRKNVKRNKGRKRKKAV